MRQDTEDRRQETEVGSRKSGFYSLFCLLFAVCCLLLIATAYAEDNPLNLMRDDALSFFKPLKGKIMTIKNGTAIADIGEKSQVKKGMRFTVFREGSMFLHPVTKEPVGLLEKVIGKAEVREVGADTSTLVILSGEVAVSDRVRLSETTVRLLFYQGINVDWSLADSYYRVLKASGRFDIVDTALETENDEEVLAEARKLNAEVAIILSAKESGGDTTLKQRLLWVDNSAKFSEYEARIPGSFVKETKLGEEFFAPKKGAAKLVLDLSYGAGLIAYGDVDGDGKTEILMSTGKDVRFHVLGEEGKVPYEIKGGAMDDHLGLDAVDINGDGRSEVLLTLMKGDAVVSRVYGFKDNKFHVIWEGNVFIKRLGNELIAQAYEAGEGYAGSVFKITLSGGYKKGEDIKLPKNVNIYDFVFIYEPDGKKLVLAYDDDGYLNLYDGDRRLWQSKEDYGGFLTTFKRAAPTVMVDRGEWSVKDRLFVQKGEVFVIKRIPFIGASRGLGYSKSQIKGLWWTGVTVEEKDIIDDIPGNALDFALAGDRLIVLDRPFLGIKIENIFKGENPLGSMLLIYSLKGR